MLRTFFAWLLNRPDLAGGHVVTWRLAWGGSWSALGFGAALAVACAVSIALYRRQDRLVGRRRQAVLIALRVLTFALILLLLCQPVLQITKTGVVKGTCVILVDRTRSMTIVDRLGHDETAAALRAIGEITGQGEGDGSTQAPVPAVRPRAHGRGAPGTASPSPFQGEGRGEGRTAPSRLPTPDSRLPILISDEQRRLVGKLDRFTLVKRAVAAQADAFLDPLADRFNVEVLAFGKQVSRSRDQGSGVRGQAPGDKTGGLTGGSLRRAFADLDAPDGEVTRLGAVLRAVLERYRGQPLAGVILMTDGANNAGEDPRVVAVYAKRLGVPVFPVGVGAAHARDLRLAHILGEDVVFKDDLKPLTIRIESAGCVGRSVTLVLAEGEAGNERVLAVKRDVVITREGAQTEEIQFVPKREGRMRLTVRIEPLPDEHSTANNARSKVVRVIDKKLRVLYVESQPRWEYRFLRHAMQRDRRVQPTFLLQEADPETAGEGAGSRGQGSGGRGQESGTEGREARETRLAAPLAGARPPVPGPGGLGDSKPDAPPPEFIRTFPERREDLFAYDVVLFGDVNVEYLTRAQLRSVAEFVAAGGGFGLIAGAIHGPTALAATPIGPVLPVVLEARRGPLDGRPTAASSIRNGRRPFDLEIYHPLTQGYHPRPTPVGGSHPVLRLAGTVEESARLWSDRPAFYWYCPSVGRLQPGAQVLLEHPTVRNRYGALPLVVAQPYGQGKSVFVGFDEVWRWRKSGPSDLPDEAGDRPFYRFYGQMIQFLGLSHLLGESRRVQVTVDRREVALGTPVTIFARVLDESFRPAVAPSVTAVIRRAPAGGARGPSGASPAARAVARVTLLAEAGAPGTYRGDFIPAEVGEYTIAIETGPEGNGAGRSAPGSRPGGAAAVTVTEPRLEFEQASRNEPLLRALADLSGGTLVELDGLAALPDEMERKQRAEPVHLDVPLWDSWLALLVVVAVPCVEWFIRKRVRLA